MIKLSNINECTGCTACKSICPKKAISLLPDKKGFYHYSVDYNLCIDCGLCEKVCPVINKSNYITQNINKCYAAWNRDNEIRKSSTSGGVFSAIANYVLENDGYVVGVCFNNDNTVSHIIIDDAESLKRLRKAKYIQSYLGDIFSKIKLLLDDDKIVLFSGTPCQVNGLKNYLIREYDKLITVDIICHGVTNQKIFNSYISSLEKIHKSKIISYDFRNKSTGWKDYSTVSVFENGEVCSKNKKDDEYLKGYLKYSLYLRPSCTDCKCKGKNRSADITLGDFWGVQNIMPFDDFNNGVSAVIINSIKGQSVITNILDYIECYPVKIENIITNNSSYYKSSVLGKCSDYFYRHFGKKDFIELIHKIDDKAVWDRNDLSIKDRVYLIKNKLFK